MIALRAPRRDSYVTAADFATMASVGINAVRIPIGYWALAVSAADVPPFVPGAWAYIDSALQWGQQYGIGETTHVAYACRRCRACAAQLPQLNFPLLL